MEPPTPELPKHLRPIDAAYGDGREVLQAYCGSCVRRPRCEWNEQTRLAMANDYPYWPKGFAMVEDRERDLATTYCQGYDNGQLALPGIAPAPALLERILLRLDEQQRERDEEFGDIAKFIDISALE